MKSINYVKTSTGTIIKLNDPPKDTHFIIEDDILWNVWNHQASHMMLQQVSLGRVIATGVTEEEVKNFKMKDDFLRYHAWCSERNFKPHEADNLIIYMNQLHAINQARYGKI